MSLREDTASADLFGKAQLLHFLSGVFLTLPTEDYLKALAAVPWRDFPLKGSELIASWLKGAADRPSDALVELGRDRSALMRSMGPRAIEPPYESLYRNQAPNASIGSLNRFYASEGYRVSGDVRDTSDQLGVELAFAALLYDKLLDALAAGDAEAAARAASARTAFETAHLGRWAKAYAREMLSAAQTDFYRGVAQLLIALPLEEG